MKIEYLEKELKVFINGEQISDKIEYKFQMKEFIQRPDRIRPLCRCGTPMVLEYPSQYPSLSDWRCKRLSCRGGEMDTKCFYALRHKALVEEEKAKKAEEERKRREFLLKQAEEEKRDKEREEAALAVIKNNPDMNALFDTLMQEGIFNDEKLRKILHEIDTYDGCFGSLSKLRYPATIFLKWWDKKGGKV